MKKTHLVALASAALSLLAWALPSASFAITNAVIYQYDGYLYPYQSEYIADLGSRTLVTPPLTYTPNLCNPINDYVYGPLYGFSPTNAACATVNPYPSGYYSYLTPTPNYPQYPIIPTVMTTPTTTTSPTTGSTLPPAPTTTP